MMYGANNGDSAKTSSATKAILKPFVFVGSFALFFLGVLAYWLGGKTPRVCFHAMRRLYGPTNGFFNRVALGIARRLRPPDPIAPLSGFLGRLSAEDIQRLVQNIDEQGYAVFDRLLPAEMCDSLLEFAQTMPCTAMGEKTPSLYSEENARALRYDFSEESVLSNPVACKIAMDGTLAAIAGAYFRCRPIYDFTAMWWTTRFGEKNYSTAAQEFHFDMDRVFFLKFFVYLTDVTLESGPHVFVAGSHKNKPRSLRDPVRFDDSQIEANYSPDAIKRICGPRGTIFAEDTSGLHKGMPVISGHRLAFQVEFTISKYGQNYPSPVVAVNALERAGISQPLDARVYPNVTFRKDG
jgi:hypothetical protein